MLSEKLGLSLSKHSPSWINTIKDRKTHLESQSNHRLSHLKNLLSVKSTIRRKEAIPEMVFNRSKSVTYVFIALGNLSIYLSIYLPIYLSIYLHIYLCIYLPTYLTINMIYLSTYITFFIMSIAMFLCSLSLFLSVSLSIYLSIYLVHLYSCF